MLRNVFINTKWPPLKFIWIEHNKGILQESDSCVNSMLMSY